jgi:3-oxoacyl-[acyl-carrier protein] reductase
MIISPFDLKTMKQSQIENKTALVTGGTRGIGYAIAEILLVRGVRVTICGTKQPGIDHAVQNLRSAHGQQHITGLVCDVGDYQQVKSMMQAVERDGGLDFLINNAGIGIFRNVEAMTPAEWRATIETNLSGLFYTCHEAIPLMRKRGGGYIINIGSLAGRNFFPGGSAYSASKAGLIGFSEALMQEVRFDHIRVSYVMPGSVETDFGSAPGQNAPAAWKLSASDVAMVVINLLESDPRSLSSRVEMRPAEPKK